MIRLDLEDSCIAYYKWRTLFKIKETLFDEIRCGTDWNLVVALLAIVPLPAFSFRVIEGVLMFLKISG